jgi:hypothetical protein
VRLYRFDVINRSDLELDLRTGSDRPFSLELLDDRGRRIECQCDSTGDQTITRRIAPGRYFVAVRAREFSSGGYTLIRRSRSITRVGLLIDGSRNDQVAPSQTVSITVTVRPAVDGPVTIDLERFDPLSRWQFYRRFRVNVSAGSAAVSFLPPYVGRWRALATFVGTRTASPSESGFAQLLVASPLTQ